MISVIVPTLNSAAGLQTLLPPLVPAAIDGLVREVIAADGGSTDATLAICEDAGVKVVTGGIVAAAAVARSDHVLILPDDLNLAEGWEASLARHLRNGGGPALLMEARRRGWQAALQSHRSGLLAARDAVAARAADADLAELHRLLGRGAPKLGR